MKISIIIPVYNGERTIGRCLESLIQQSYKKIEIIIIDDGSTDHTSEICREYEKQDERIKYFLIKNSGVSFARNYGLDAANGDVIGFVDADDYVAFNMYEKMMEIMQTYDADIVVCGFDHGEEKKKRYEGQIVHCTVFDSFQLKEALVLNSQMGGFLWNKIFRIELIDKRRLNEHMDIMEDMEFCFRLSESVKKAAYLDEKLYCYCIDNNNVTSTPQRLFDNQYRLKYLTAYDDICSKYFSENSRMISIINNIKINICIQTIHRIIVENWGRNYYRALMIYAQKTFLFDSEYSILLKARYFVFLFPNLYKKIVLIKNTIRSKRRKYE